MTLAHAPQNFWPLINRGELAVVYCFLFLYFAVAGGGVWSVDHRLRIRSDESRAPSRDQRMHARGT